MTDLKSSSSQYSRLSSADPEDSTNPEDSTEIKDTYEPYYISNFTNLCTIPITQYINYDKLAYYYLLLNQYTSYYYDRVYLMFFDIEDIQIRNKNSIYSVFYRYVLLRILMTMPTYIVNSLVNLVDSEYDQVKLIKLFENNRKYIILNNDDSSRKLSSLVQTISEIDASQMSMVNAIILTFELTKSKKDDTEENDSINKQPELEAICLKDLLNTYNDQNQEYDHTLRNILMFNQVDLNLYDTLKVKMFQGGKLIQKQVLLETILDKHINLLLNDL